MVLILCIGNSCRSHLAGAILFGFVSCIAMVLV